MDKHQGDLELAAKTKHLEIAIVFVKSAIPAPLKNKDIPVENR